MKTPQPGRSLSPRAYHRSGLYTMSRALPEIMTRIVDASVPDEALSPVERAARTWRGRVLADLGGLDQVPAWRVVLLDEATASKIILDVLDDYLLNLIANGGVVNQKQRKLYHVVPQRMRIANRLVRQLRAVELEGGE